MGQLHFHILINVKTPSFSINRLLFLISLGGSHAAATKVYVGVSLAHIYNYLFHFRQCCEIYIGHYGGRLIVLLYSVHIDVAYVKQTKNNNFKAMLNAIMVG